MPTRIFAPAALAVMLICLPRTVFATTCTSVAACVLGNNAGTGVGLEGVSQTNVGLYGVSTSNHGIDGRSRQSYGVVGYTYAVPSAPASGGYQNPAGVYGIDLGTGPYDSGVLGFSRDGTGVTGSGTVGVSAVGFNDGVVANGGLIGGYFSSYGSNAPTLYLENTFGGPLIQAVGSQGTGGARTPQVDFTIDAVGNENLRGTLTQNGTLASRTRTTGSDVVSYGARSALPSLEDFGSATLRDGSTSVALDRTFASAIDTRSYMVFVTPHGNSNGLYAQTSPTGFSVHENNDGHSSVAFDYRIVAKPIDTPTRHLPLATTLGRPMFRPAISAHM